MLCWRKDRLCCWLQEKDKKKKKEKKDPYSKTAQEKARLEAQQRLMGIDTNKKAAKKKKKKLLGLFSTTCFAGLWELVTLCWELYPESLAQPESSIVVPEHAACIWVCDPCGPLKVPMGTAA